MNGAPVVASRPLAIGLVLAVTTFAFDSLSVTAAMPAIVDDLGGVSLYGAAFSAFMLANLFSLVVAGVEADRHGPGVVLGAGLVCFAAGLVIGGLAVSMEMVVVGRAVQGLGGGAIGSSAYVTIARGFPTDSRARMFAVLSAAWIVPALVAPGVAGAVAEHASWRLVFLGLLPFPFVAAALALPAMRTLGRVEVTTGDDEARGRGSRVVAALRVSVGTALVVTGTQTDRTAVLVALIAAGVVLGAPALAKLLPSGTLRARPVLPAVVATRAMLTWAFFGADAFIPLAITSARGASTVTAGLALTTSSLSWSASAWLQARWARRSVPARTMVVAGVLTLAAGIAVTALVLVDGMPVGIAFAGWAVGGAGMGLAFNTTSVAALDEAPPGREGVTSSSLQLADALGVAVATGLGGAVVGLGERSGWSPASALWWVFAISGAGALVAAAAAARLPGRRVPAVQPPGSHIVVR